MTTQALVPGTDAYDRQEFDTYVGGSPASDIDELSRHSPSRPSFTSGDLAGAIRVRDDRGWHSVVRTGLTHVTVRSPVTGQDEEIANERILQRSRLEEIGHA